MKKQLYIQVGIGAALLLMGATAPMTKNPIYGDISLFSHGGGDGELLVVGALSAIGILFTKLRFPYYIIGLLGLAIFHVHSDFIQGQAHKVNSGIEWLNLLADINFTNTEFFQIGSGLTFVLLGSLTIFTAPAINWFISRQGNATIPPPLPKEN